VIELWAPAKLNLFLEVHGKRDDGYHEIESLMLPISMYDTITLRRTSDAKIGWSCQLAASHTWRATSSVPCDSENLALLAAQALRRSAKVEQGVEIQLFKRVPVGAGLGGGSSDAAAVLWGLNRLWKLDWPSERLREIGAQLGSDVPFFLIGGAAVVRGRGEQLHCRVSLPPMHFVVAVPAAANPTSRVYQQCVIPGSPRRLFPHPTPSGPLSHSAVRALQFNRLQDAAQHINPQIAQVRHELSRLGAEQPQVTGSGSACFAICRDRASARRLAQGVTRIPGVRGFAAVGVTGIRRRDVHPNSLPGARSWR
jgi:4-diphosphocytidyl-2-C-methyl-D-erythritol kinase